jgi:two-component system C4-dicarboxylate transport sensor histidine kinase DctB
MERVIVTDSDGVVFLTSNPAYRYRGIGQLGSPRRGEHNAVDRYKGLPVEDIEAKLLERRGGDQLIAINGPEGAVSYLSQAISLPEYGWTIHRFVDLDSVNEDRRDGGIIGGSISALLILLALYLIQRHRAYLEARRSGAELQRQVAERTRELSDANISLHTEIEDHRRTEARLRTTQNELVQAGKLAALGQMSAALAHEINQPLAAIRTYMASTKIFAQRGELAQVLRNLGFINDLAERMAAVTGHLKTFARKSEPGHSEPVEVDKSVDRALFLLESQVKAAGVRIEKTIPHDLCVMGYAVQLEQVILNLVRNALDAVAGRADPRIWITASASDEVVSLAVADNGPGISAVEIGRIFDPFFTTKPLGKGLGLGLSISSGIVQVFGGQIHAVNRPQGGAELTVELPRHRHAAAVLAGQAVHA